MINSLLESIQNVITLSSAGKDLVIALFKEKTYKKGDFFLAGGQVVSRLDL